MGSDLSITVIAIYTFGIPQSHACICSECLCFIWVFWPVRKKVPIKALEGLYVPSNSQTIIMQMQLMRFSGIFLERFRQFPIWETRKPRDFEAVVSNLRKFHNNEFEFDGVIKISKHRPLQWLSFCMFKMLASVFSLKLFRVKIFFVALRVICFCQQGLK